MGGTILALPAKSGIPNGLRESRNGVPVDTLPSLGMATSAVPSPATLLFNKFRAYYLISCLMIPAAAASSPAKHSCATLTSSVSSSSTDWLFLKSIWLIYYIELYFSTVDIPWKRRYASSYDTASFLLCCKLCEYY